MLHHFFTVLSSVRGYSIWSLHFICIHHHIQNKIFTYHYLSVTSCSWRSHASWRSWQGSWHSDQYANSLVVARWFCFFHSLGILQKLRYPSFLKETCVSSECLHVVCEREVLEASSLKTLKNEVRAISEHREDFHMYPSKTSIYCIICFTYNQVRLVDLPNSFQLFSNIITECDQFF